MNFEVRDEIELGGVRVVSVRGELDLGTVDELRRLLPDEPSVAAPTVIDLSECEFMDSTGLSTLVSATRAAEADGHPGLQIVAEPGGQVRKLLRLTSLDSQLPVVDSRAAALAAVGEGRDTQPV